MTEVRNEADERRLVQCILCTRDYDRKERERYRPLGAFVNYCLCEDCLQKDKAGWNQHQ